jgi:hypothetical protein
MATQSNKITDHYYANVIIKNDSDRIITAEYDSTRDIAILGQQNDFKIALIRAKIPLDSMPLFLFEDLKYYISFGLSSNPDPLKPHATNNILEPKEIQYIPYNNQPILGFELTKPVFYYSEFLEMINTQLEALWEEAIVDANYIPIFNANYVSTAPPFFRFNQLSNIIELVCPRNNKTNPGDPECPFYPTNLNGIKILMSSPLHVFLNGFASTYYSELGVTGVPPIPPSLVPVTLTYHLNIRTTFKDLGTTVTDFETENDLYPAGDYLCITQDYSSISAFRQFVKLVLTSTLSVAKESLLISGQGGTPQTLEVLTDLEFLDFAPAIHRQNAFLIPRAEWRFQDIKDSGPLRRFDIKVFVQYRNSRELIRLPILPGEEFSAKFAFVRRKHNELKQITDDMYATL